MLRPGESTEALYQAGLGRARADWLTGMNLSRLFTLKGRQTGEKGVYSVGRVQTPTLRMIVDREREIATFVPRDYWTLEVKLTTRASGNATFQADWQPPEAFCDAEGRCIREAAIQRAADEIRQSGIAQVVSTQTRRVKASAPLPFDLDTLQQHCSKRWGMGAQQVLDIAQSLYETHKVTSYPRSDCGYLPVSMLTDAPQVLRAILAGLPGLSPVLALCRTEQKSRVWNDSQITAHHGIIPTIKPADITRMSEDERRVYDLICRHYLAQFLPLHEVDSTIAQLICGGHQLLSRGNLVVVPGWEQVFSGREDSDSSHQVLPHLEKGTVCPVCDTMITPRKTRPPEHYTEGTLIAAMKQASRFVTDVRLKQRLRESTGLGTEATRAGVIETLLHRGYLRREKRYLISTDSAGALMEMLPDIVKDPGLTALWEQALDEIAAGRLPLAVFLQKQSEWVTAMVAQTRQSF